MKYYSHLSNLFLVFCVIFRISKSNAKMSHHEILMLREETRSAFLHSYHSYLNYGYPYDEVMPISCNARKHNQRTRGDLDDVLGGYMLTLVDSLDTLLIMREFKLFKEALNLLDLLSFNRDIEVSVFEANIRILGGLLSAHQLAVVVCPNSTYNGESLLNYAIDIGNRLLPAFSTQTGIPIHRVNLRYGKLTNSKNFTCTAAGGTFLLEMGLLSRLSGNPIYEIAAFKATKAIWERRSAIGLVGSLIDTQTGQWLQEHTGIGAGVDSFYETLLKSSILLGDSSMLHWFEDVYKAVQLHTLHQGYHIEVSRVHGNKQLYSFFISSLQAFWPALQTLAGKVTAAQQTFSQLFKLWEKYSALPDIFDLATGSTITFAKDAPLRPELIESAYHLYVATKSPLYLEFGKAMFMTLQNTSRVTCGYAAIADVNTGRLDDRMDSYFLAETLKYLFLLFDEALPPSHRASLFCSSGHSHSHASSSSPPPYSTKPYSPNSQLYNYTSTPPHPLPPSYNNDNSVCISKLLSIFSTEGHVFLIDEKIRPVSVPVPEAPPASMSRRTASNKIRRKDQRLQSEQRQYFCPAIKQI